MCRSISPQAEANCSRFSSGSCFGRSSQSGNGPSLTRFLHASDLLRSRGLPRCLYGSVKELRLTWDRRHLRVFLIWSSSAIHAHCWRHTKELGGRSCQSSHVSCRTLEASTLCSKAFLRLPPSKADYLPSPTGPRVSMSCPPFPSLLP